MLELPLTPGLEHRLAEEAERHGVPPAECAIHLLDEKLRPNGGHEALAAALKSWMEAGDAQEQRETGDYLVREPDEDRPPGRSDPSRIPCSPREARPAPDGSGNWRRPARDSSSRRSPIPQSIAAR